MKRVFYSGILLPLLLCHYRSMGQQPAEQMFRVVGLPLKAGFDKDELNHRLFSVKRKDSARSVIITSIKNFHGVTVIIRVSRPGNRFNWWTINLEKNKDTETDAILLRSKVTEPGKISRLQDLRELLKDTVFVKDTLSLQLSLHNEDLPGNKYFLSTTCNATDFASRITLYPNADGYLLITKSMFNSCPDSFHKVVLRNKVNPDRSLATFVLFFPNENLEETLLMLADQLRMEKTVQGEKAVADYMDAYIQQNFGKISYKQLTRWLHSNHKSN